MLTEAIKQKIRLSIEAGRKPKQGNKSGDWLLRFGGRGYSKLIIRGAVTDAGEYAQQQGLELPDEGYDRNQP